MTKEAKIEVLKNSTNEELLGFFSKYTKNVLEMNDSERETYEILREEILNRMSR